MYDFSDVTRSIREIVANEEKMLLELPQDVYTTRFNIQDRNIKMLLGHMVDSACNNQQRLVGPRCQGGNVGVSGLYPGQ